MKIPVHIVTGFLGSGKTTALLHFLSHLQSERIAVIANDFGSEGLDTEILRLNAFANVTIHRVPEGCICCSAATGFIFALLNILESERPDRIFIEPTGLAKLSEIQRLLRQPDLQIQIERRATLALVDTRRLSTGAFFEHPLFHEQIRSATMLVGNFADAVSEDVKTRFGAWSYENGFDSASMLLTEFAKIPTEVLGVPEKSTVGAFGVSRVKPLSDFVENNAPMHAQRVLTFDHTSTDGFSQCGWAWKAVIPFTCLRHFANDLEQNGWQGLLRLKGLFQTDEGLFEIQFSSDGFQTEGRSVDLKKHHENRDTSVMQSQMEAIAIKAHSGVLQKIETLMIEKWQIELTLSPQK